MIHPRENGATKWILNRSTTESGFVGGCRKRVWGCYQQKWWERSKIYWVHVQTPDLEFKLHIIWSNDSDNILRLSQAQIQQPAGIAQQQNSNVQWVCEKSRSGDSPEMFSQRPEFFASRRSGLWKGPPFSQSPSGQHPHEGNQSCHEFLSPSCQSFSATAVAHQTHQQEEFLLDLGLNMRNIRGEHFNQCHTTGSMGKI